MLSYLCPLVELILEAQSILAGIINYLASPGNNPNSLEVIVHHIYRNRLFSNSILYTLWSHHETAQLPGWLFPGANSIAQARLRAVTLRITKLFYQSNAWVSNCVFLLCFLGSWEEFFIFLDKYCGFCIERWLRYLVICYHMFLGVC